MKRTHYYYYLVIQKEIYWEAGKLAWNKGACINCWYTLMSR